MIFNSQPTVANLLEAPYSAGNCLFAGDILYSPVSNSVKRIDLKRNTTTLLPFQARHHISLIAITPSHALLLAVDYAGHGTFFNLEGQFVVGQFNFKGPVKSVAFSNDGRLLGVAKDSGFWVYECDSLYRCFEPLVLLKKYKSRHSGTVTGLTFSDDGRFLVTRGDDNVIFINNLYPFPEYIAVSLQAHRFTIIATFFSHDSKYLYTIDAGNNLFAWLWTNQLTEGYQNRVQGAKRVRKNRRGGQEGERQHQTPNLSEFETKMITGRYVLNKKLSLGQGGWLKRVAFKPETGFLTGAYANGRFCIWRLVNQELEEVQSFSVGENKISTIAINDGCTWLALGIKSLGQLLVWEWKSQSYIINQRGLLFETRALASNGVSLYATGNNEGAVRLWDSVSQFSTGLFQDHQAAISALKFSNSNTLFSTSLDGSVHAYDTTKQRRFRVFTPDKRSQLVCLETDPNGEVVFAGAFDPYDVYAWNVQTGHLLQIISGHEGPLSCLAFHQDTLVTGSWDRTVKLHAVFARKLNVETLQHGSQITAMAIHPIKPQVAVATMKGEVYLWNCVSGDMQGVLEGEMQGGRSYFSKVSAQNDASSKFIKALAYSPDGQYLYGGGKSKYLHVYDIRHRMLLTRLTLTCNRDIQGVVEQLNSRYVKNGLPTYQLQVQAQNEIYSDEENKEKLPGSKRIDISEIRMKLQAEVKSIVVLSSKQLLVGTSFGTLLISAVPNRRVFNPYELMPQLTPSLLPELMKKQEYSSAVLVCLKLNLAIRKLLPKIPIEHSQAVCLQLQSQYAQLLLQKICEGGKLSLRECTWVQQLLKMGYRAPESLRGGLQCLQDQCRVLMEVKGRLEMVQVLSD